MLNSTMDDLSDDVDVVFWSGGKDSFLALRRMQAKNTRDILLLTTYDVATQQVAHQNVKISDISRQAVAMKMPLLGVPVGGADYLSVIGTALQKLRNEGIQISRLAFGDLHLEHVRQWRDTQFSSLDVDLHYPLWNVKYDDLLEELESSQVPITISAVDDAAESAGVRIGDRFDKDFVNKLPKSIDRFGENGEFHTLVRVWP